MGVFIICGSSVRLEFRVPLPGYFDAAQAFPRSLALRGVSVAVLGHSRQSSLPQCSVLICHGPHYQRLTR
jgi:hypothetical protein